MGIIIYIGLICIASYWLIKENSTKEKIKTDPLITIIFSCVYIWLIVDTIHEIIKLIK